MFNRGTVLSVISGLFYGLSFTPVIYIQDNYTGASKNGKILIFNMCQCFIIKLGSE